jgi:hypothetical protein
MSLGISSMTVKNGDTTLFGGIDTLPPNQPSTQNCAINGTSPIGVEVVEPLKVTIDFSVEYDFPIIPSGWIRSANTRHFSVRPSPDGKKILLVPDVLESPIKY